MKAIIEYIEARAQKCADNGDFANQSAKETKKRSERRRYQSEASYHYAIQTELRLLALDLDHGAVPPEPIPLILNCPTCGSRHVDEGEWASRVHHTHACQFCGLTWRPAIAPTVGVQFLPGFRNQPVVLSHATRRRKGTP